MRLRFGVFLGVRPYIFLFLALLCGLSPAADFVQVSVDSEESSQNTGAQNRQIEITVVEPGPGDSASTPWSILNAKAQETLAANPSAPIAFVCAASAACQAGKESLASFPFQVVPAVSGTSAPPPTAAADGPSDWKGRITVIRILMNGVVGGLTAVFDPHTAATVMQGLAVGSTSGATTGLRSYFNTPLLNWDAHERWGTVQPPNPEAGELASLPTRILKRAIISGIGNGILMASYIAAGLDHSGGDWEKIAWKWGLSVVTSLAGQLPWEVVNQRWTEEAVRRDPNNAGLYRRYSGFGSLAQNVLSRITGGLTMGGGYVGTVIAGTVGAAGFITASWKYVPERVRARVSQVAQASKAGLCAAWRYVSGHGAEAK